MIGWRVSLSALLAAGIVAAAAPPARSQPYPVRPITLIVPFAAGGGADTVARIVAEHMAKTLRQPIVIENVPGAGGTTATRRAASAAPDGYTIMMGNMGTHGAAPALNPSLKYDPEQDFTPIGLTAAQAVVVVTRKDFPAGDLAAFIGYVRKNQGSVNEAHAGVGSVSHAVCTLLQSLIGTRTGRVAYRGLGPAISDLVGGQVDFGCVTLSNVVAQIQAGTLKAIAVASPERAGVIRDVPTASEAGLPGLQAPSWNAIFAPRGLPRDIQARLNAAVVTALDDADTRKRLLDLGGIIPGPAERTPQALQRLVESEVARWGPLLRAAGGGGN